MKTEFTKFYRIFPAGILFIALILSLSGCAAYSRSALTPDSFNYTVAVDHDPMRVDQHWFGFSWNLKRSVTP